VLDLRSSIEEENEEDSPPKKKKKSNRLSDQTKMEMPSRRTIELEIGVKIAHQQAQPPPEIQSLASPLLSSPDPTDTRTRHQSMVQTNFPLPPEFQSKRISIFQTEEGGIRSVTKDEFYFVGIIDILMKYTLRKRAEHTYKILRYGVSSDAISSVNPKEYSERFQKFIESIIE